MTDKQEVAALRILGQRMREARELCGSSATSHLSIKDASTMLGVSPRYLADLESCIDIDHVKLSLILMAADLYSVGIGFLLGQDSDWEVCDEVMFERQVGFGLHKIHIEQISIVATEHMRQQKRQNILVDVVDKLLPLISGVAESLENFKEKNRGWESMLVGSQLAYRVRVALQTANECKYQLTHGKIIPYVRGETA